MGQSGYGITAQVRCIQSVDKETGDLLHPLTDREREREGT